MKKKIKFDGDFISKKSKIDTESERIKLRFVPDKYFDVVDIPRNKTGFMFGARFAFGI